MKFFNLIQQVIFPEKEIDPAHAYDRWSGQYDDQPGNLMLQLDERIVSELLNNISITNKIVADIGCGTGRHWPKIFQQHPASLMGFDVSEGMLKIVKQKFPHVETHLITNTDLDVLKNNSCDIILSTLTVAHIENIEEALTEWDRTLKPGGDILITDYHPEALAKGAKRTFNYKGKTMTVKNHIHFVEEIKTFAGQQLHWTTIRFMEIKIDETIKPFYEKQNAMTVYEKFKGTPVIYGLHLKKAGDTI